jgi:tRNA-guanine family transglycosylase
MLPTFMPVATQAAIKGLTPQQVEACGVNLILNNTYHLSLRPGTNILDAAGGAHRVSLVVCALLQPANRRQFQGWRHNMLTVSTV